jgi:hypothetical protein
LSAVAAEMRVRERLAAMTAEMDQPQPLRITG